MQAVAYNTHTWKSAHGIWDYTRYNKRETVENSNKSALYSKGYLQLHRNKYYIL